MFRKIKTHLNRLFVNPPKGGNEAGPPTVNSMSPIPPAARGPSARGGVPLMARPTYQTGALRGSLEAGELTARANSLESREGGQPDLRNFTPGYEEDENGKPRPGSGRPDLKIRPNTRHQRSDGKPNPSMGRANANPTPYKGDRGPGYRGGGFE